MTRDAANDDEGDDLDAQDRERLHAAITRSEEQVRAGQGIPAEAALEELERLRKR